MGINLIIILIGSYEPYKRQENKLSMYIFVEDVCNKYETVWANVKAFADAKNKFGGIIWEIQLERQTQEMNYKKKKKEGKLQKNS